MARQIIAQELSAVSVTTQAEANSALIAARESFIEQLLQNLPNVINATFHSRAGAVDQGFGQNIASSLNVHINFQLGNECFLVFSFNGLAPSSGASWLAFCAFLRPTPLSTTAQGGIPTTASQILIGSQSSGSYPSQSAAGTIMEGSHITDRFLQGKMTLEALCLTDTFCRFITGGAYRGTLIRPKIKTSWAYPATEWFLLSGSNLYYLNTNTSVGSISPAGLLNNFDDETQKQYHNALFASNGSYLGDISDIDEEIISVGTMPVSGKFVVFNGQTYFAQTTTLLVRV